MKYFILKPFYALVIFIFAAPCFGQVKTPLPKDSVSESEKNLLGPLAIDFQLEAIDPYFAETRDTISIHGPGNITRNILQDRNGNIWLATWGGIVCYDGKYFTNFTLKAGLRHFHVFSVLEDKKGNLWFGTIRGGLYRYDGKSFTLFTTKDGLADNIITCMLEDREGNIWFGTDNGVSRYDDKTFTNFTTLDGLSGNSVNSMVQDKAGKIWFGTQYGVNGDICCYDGKSFTNFTNREGLTFSNVRSIIADCKGNIWIGSKEGLFRYDGQSLANISRHFTGYIFEDKAGNLWSGESDIHGMALYRYDGISSTKIVASAQVFGITEDAGGNIWYGTMNGVYRYDGKSFIGFTD